MGRQTRRSETHPRSSGALPPARRVMGASSRRAGAGPGWPAVWWPWPRWAWRPTAKWPQCDLRSRQRRRHPVLPKSPRIPMPRRLRSPDGRDCPGQAPICSVFRSLSRPGLAFFEFLRIGFCLDFRLERGTSRSSRRPQVVVETIFCCFPRGSLVLGRVNSLQFVAFCEQRGHCDWRRRLETPRAARKVGPVFRVLGVAANAITSVPSVGSTFRIASCRRVASPYVRRLQARLPSGTGRRRPRLLWVSGLAKACRFVAWLCGFRTTDQYKSSPRL